jgi:hypothetical protein
MPVNISGIEDQEHILKECVIRYFDNPGNDDTSA